MLIDPTNEISSRIVVENLITNQAAKKTILGFLADSILKADKLGERSGKWSVTLGASGQFIRMNVGRIEVFAVYPDTARVIVDFRKLPKTDTVRLQSLKGHFLEETPVYVSVVCSQMWLFPVERFPAALLIIGKAHESLLEEAAASVKWRTGYYKKHSPRLLEYLRQETGRNIPDPNYI